MAQRKKKAAKAKSTSRGSSRKKTTKSKRSSSSAAPRRARSKETIVVYIHGIGIHPEPDVLKLEWDLSLFGRDMGARTRMAYWSDVVHPKSKQSRAQSRGERTALEAAPLLKEANVDPGDERALSFVEALAASLAQVPAPPRRGSQKKVLPLPGFLRRPIAERFLRWFVKDTAAYFFNPIARRKIKARLVQQIPTGGEPFVLVAHSQGTIVAFEVLSELSNRSEVSLFATIGSPLGLREIQDLLEDQGHKMQPPDDVRAWHNFADRLDPVALDATLAQDFAHEGKIEVHDHLIVNERTKDLLRLNPHSAVGYLANPAVRSAVHHATGFDTAGRFIVARDVAEGFVGTLERQPVLIEALHPGYRALGESDDDLERREADLKPEFKKLEGRIDHLAATIEAEVTKNAKLVGSDPKTAVESARVQRLRKYVAAHLTRDEILRIAQKHVEYNVYALWRSSEKRKFVRRSLRAIKVDAANASYGADGSDVTWAVLDTGVRRDHPHFNNGDLGPTIVGLLDCTTLSDEPEPIEDAASGDRDGHGTHVAGIIAGGSEDERGRWWGMAPRTKLLVYKVLDDDGFGEDAWIIKAIDDIYRRNDAGSGLQIHGVNLSLGGTFDPTVYGCGHSPICSELRDLWRQGVLVCVAAGNEGQIQVLTSEGGFALNTQLSIGDPANLEDCIAVGSVNSDKPHLYGISYFSSRGPTADGRPKPDVVAPGERIRSANSEFRGVGRGKKRRYERLYRADSGTSMACPHVSGMLAAFLSVRSEFRGRPDEVKKILLDNCNDLQRDRYHQGAGLPNLMKMLINT